MSEPKLAEPPGGPDDGIVIGRKIARKATVASTMDEARAAGAAGEAEGLVVLAGRQSAGRGRYGRRWLSAPGQDVLMSVLLRPQSRVARELLMMAALAASRTVDALAGVRSTIKWPNDVRIDGRKVCGVIAESESGPDGVVAVIGIGLNVNSDPSEWAEIAGTATSLRIATGREVSGEEATRVLIQELDGLYRWMRAGESVRDEWAGRVDTVGQCVEVAWGEGPSCRRLRGLAEGVDSDGRLLVRDAEGRVRPVAAGEVTLSAGEELGSDDG